MGVEEDFETIKGLQEDFRGQHGEYFECVFDRSVSVPTIGTDLKISKLNRFISLNDVASDIKEIDFLPTAKDYKWTVGKGIYRNIAGETIGRVYMITAERKLVGGKFDRITFKGGDEKYRDKGD